MLVRKHSPPCNDRLLLQRFPPLCTHAGQQRANLCRSRSACGLISSASGRRCLSAALQQLRVLLLPLPLHGRGLSTGPLLLRLLLLPLRLAVVLLRVLCLLLLRLLRRLQLGLQPARHRLGRHAAL